MRFLFLFILYLSSNVAIAFPRNHLKPGGVAILSVAPSSAKKPFVSYHKRPVALIKGKTNWLAIIDISLQTKAGVEHITIEGCFWQNSPEEIYG